MAIDNSMYRNMRAPDIAGGIKEGMSMRDMIDQRNKAKALDQAYKSGVAQNPDGTNTIDQEKMISAVAGVDPLKASEMKSQYQAQKIQMDDAQMQKNLREIDLIGRALGGVNDDQSWEMAKQTLSQAGVDVSQYANTPYDPKLKEYLFGMTLTAKDRMAQQLQRAQIGKLEAETGKIRREASQTSTAPMAANLTEGEKAADKDYGKQFTKYTATGRNNAVNTILKLKQLQKEVAADTGFGEAGGTRLPIPDMFRSRLAIERRDDARNFANKTLKELFGGQLSDAEREAAAREFWNDSLDNESNAKRLAGKIKELEDNVRAQDAQAEYFRKNRTLRGFSYNPNADAIRDDESAQASGMARTFKTNEIQWMD